MIASIKFCNMTIVGTSHVQVSKRVTEVLTALGEIRTAEDNKLFRVSISLSNDDVTNLPK